MGNEMGLEKSRSNGIIMVFLSPIANSSGKRLLEASAKISDLYLPCASRSGSVKIQNLHGQKTATRRHTTKGFHATSMDRA